MFLTIPLGGIGLRFKKNGYTVPKALINLLGKPILYYLLDNIDYTKLDFIYIPYNKEYKKYNLKERLKKDYPNYKFKFYTLEKNTSGAAETLYLALKNLNIPDTPVLCMDGDCFYTTPIIEKWNGSNSIFSITDNTSNPIYSYLEIDKNNKITNIIEKIKISDNACTGAYGFSSYKILLQYTEIIINNNIKQQGEFYTSTVIKEMIKKETFYNINIPKKYWNCIGTPIQLRQFCNNFPNTSFNGIKKINNLRICFDLDNTLVTYPTVQGDYTTVKPIQKY